MVLTFGGVDPSGGAGLQADALTLHALACHPAPICTAITVQDTHTAARFSPTDPELVRAQAQAVIADMPVAACKTGMLAGIETVRVVAELMAQLGTVPLVVDPVLAAGGGAALSQPGLAEALRQELLPLATLATPNIRELRQLAPQRDPAAAAVELLADGCSDLLLTGTHADTADVEHRLYRRDGSVIASRWQRLPGEYHGSGCTLASAAAGLLAQGHSLPEAVQQALSYTWHTLAQSYAAGRGQTSPHRLSPP